MQTKLEQAEIIIKYKSCNTKQHYIYCDNCHFCKECSEITHNRILLNQEKSPFFNDEDMYKVADDYINGRRKKIERILKK